MRTGYYWPLPQSPSNLYRPHIFSLRHAVPAAGAILLSVGVSISLLSHSIRNRAILTENPAQRRFRSHAIDHVPICWNKSCRRRGYNRTDSLLREDRTSQPDDKKTPRSRTRQAVIDRDCRGRQTTTCRNRTCPRPDPCSPRVPQHRTNHVWLCGAARAISR
jgi:hypothetical protein